MLLPYGYHPVSAPPGYRVYYLWALAGDERRLVPYEDPQHRWIHDAAGRRARARLIQRGGEHATDFTACVRGRRGRDGGARGVAARGDAVRRPHGLQRLGAERRDLAGLRPRAGGRLEGVRPRVRRPARDQQEEHHELGREGGGRGAPSPREVPRPRRVHRVADLQGRLARRAAVEVQPRRAPSSARRSPSSSRTSCSSARSSWRSAFNTDRIRIFDFWRLDDQAPYRKDDRREGPRGGGQGGQARPHARHRERDGVQHGDRRRVGAAAERDPGAGARAQLGSGQRVAPRRDPVSRRLREAAEGTHRSRALQGRRRRAPTARRGSGRRWAAASSTGPDSSAR